MEAGRYRRSGIGADTTLAHIIHRVEDAQDAKAKTQAFIDRFSTWYMPAVMILALIAVNTKLQCEGHRVGMLVHKESVLVVVLNAMRLMRNDKHGTAEAIP